MILSLTLTDFMAHGSTTLELAPGLNVLCGPNNTGKSAVVEALRCLASNPPPRHYIRHGASEARVEALLDSGWRVTWIRRKAHALYELHPPGESQPQVFAKLGKSMVPAEVTQALKLAPVSFEKGEAVDVHLGDQRHPIFLLDQPGSMLADFLASSTESAHLMAMQDLLRDKVRRSRAELRHLEERVIRAENGLDRLDGLPGVSLKLEELREEGRDLAARASVVPELESRLERLAGLAATTARLAARGRLLAGLEPPPGLAPSAGLASALEELSRLRVRASAARAQSLHLKGLSAPPVPAPAALLAETLARLERLGSLKSSAARRLGGLSRLSPPPSAADPAPLAGLIDSMAVLAARIAKGREWLAARERELEQLRATIARRLEEVGECPLCGGALDAGKFLKKAGGRGTS